MLNHFLGLSDIIILIRHWGYPVSQVSESPPLGHLGASYCEGAGATVIDV